MKIIKEFKRFAKDTENALDLTKRYPNYFGAHTKVLIYVAVILCFGLIGISYQIDGISKIYVECPCDTYIQCYNPLFEPFCDKELCMKEYLEPCELIGEKPSKFSQSLGNWFFFIIALVVLINHIIWDWRFKK